jgi:hypothetical protein
MIQLFEERREDRLVPWFLECACRWRRQLPPQAMGSGMDGTEIRLYMQPTVCRPNAKPWALVSSAAISVDSDWATIADEERGCPLTKQRPSISPSNPSLIPHIECIDPRPRRPPRAYSTPPPTKITSPDLTFPPPAPSRPAVGLAVVVLFPVAVRVEHAVHLALEVLDLDLVLLESL